jgi:hypothetical protein
VLASQAGSSVEVAAVVARMVEETGAEEKVVAVGAEEVKAEGARVDSEGTAAVAVENEALLAAGWVGYGAAEMVQAARVMAAEVARAPATKAPEVVVERASEWAHCTSRRQSRPRTSR